MNVEGTDSPPSVLAWFTSSYSAGNGGECVEVAFDWRTSSRSAGNGGDCVEVAADAEAVHVRDSKHRTGPVLGFSPEQWTSFVAFAARHPSV